MTLTSETVGQDFDEIALTLDELLLKHIEYVATGGRHGKQLVIDNTDMRKGVSFAAQRLTAMKALRCTFGEMDLRGIELQGARFEECDFRKAQMQNGDLRGASFKKCIMNRANFSNAKMGALIIRKPDGVSQQLPCRFESAQLRQAIFSGTRLTDAVFTDADLTDADFTNCDLTRADFRGAKLENTNFENAILDHAQFDPK
jgi:uncharacterized protein YjbI with pentapeptide repeats